MANNIIRKIATHMESDAAAPSTSAYKHKATGQNCVQLLLFQNEMKLIVEVLKTLISHLTIAYNYNNNNNNTVKRWERKLYFTNIGTVDEWAIVAIAVPFILYSLPPPPSLRHFHSDQESCDGKQEPTIVHRCQLDQCTPWTN